MEIKFAFADVVQIIVALIGLIGVIYSARAAKKERKSPKASQADNQYSPRKSTILTWASILLLIANFAVLGWRSWDSPTTDVKITEPVAGDIVEMLKVVKGTSRKIPAGQVIWVVIYSQAVGRYYPQNDPADVQANGGWSSLCSIGINQDTGKKFDIVAMLANKETQDEIKAYLAKARDQQTWAGVERIPGSAVIYDRVTVVRK
jgi:hypothetical protein